MQLLTSGPKTDTDNPDAEAVAAAIAAMNGGESSEVILFVDEQTHLIVGGGPTEFWCLATVRGKRKVLLARPRVPTDRLRRVVVGQPDMFPEAEVVTAKEAAMAAHHFLEFRECSTQRLWAEEE